MFPYSPSTPNPAQQRQQSVLSGLSPCLSWCIQRCAIACWPTSIFMLMRCPLTCSGVRSSSSQCSTIRCCLHNMACIGKPSLAIVSIFFLSDGQHLARYAYRPCPVPEPCSLRTSAEHRSRDLLAGHITSALLHGPAR